jgi:hypothetical protein
VDAPKVAQIDIPEVISVIENEDDVGMLNPRLVRPAIEQASGHLEVNDQPVTVRQGQDEILPAAAEAGYRLADDRLQKCFCVGMADELGDEDFNPVDAPTDDPALQGSANCFNFW